MWLIGGNPFCKRKTLCEMGVCALHVTVMHII
jgi:hypothetical protein